MEAIWKRALIDQKHNWKCHIEKILPPEFFSFYIYKHDVELAACVQRLPNNSERTPTAHT